MSDGINDKSLWNDPKIDETIKRMGPEQTYKYQKFSESLFDDVEILASSNVDAAAQIHLMLRDGLHPDMLEENERQLYIDTYGLKSLEMYGKDDEHSDDNRPISSTQAEDRESPSNHDGNEKGRKGTD